MSSTDLKARGGRKKVLIIGMLDSVHFARWLKQFENRDIDFYILASKKYRRINPILASLLAEHHLASYVQVFFGSLSHLGGYLDFGAFVLPQKLFRLNLRTRFLSYILKKSRFDYVHALEIQGAGYLASSVNPTLYAETKVIVTNWGSDIYFYKNHVNHKVLIERTLSIADFYSAECIRDYMLARELGFDGVDLPCIPNAGGFDLRKDPRRFTLTSERKQVLIKGYGKTFGRAELVIKLLPDLAKKYPQLSFHFYSVTEDILEIINTLPDTLTSNIRITTTNKKLSHSEMMAEFEKSRIYIGCSESDGISTSFLEALITGCYPIQTDTSCANEWLNRGVIASIVQLDSETLLREVEKAIQDDNYVNRAAESNRQIAEDFLSYKVIQEQSFKFYS